MVIGDIFSEEDKTYHMQRSNIRFYPKKMPQKAYNLLEALYPSERYALLPKVHSERNALLKKVHSERTLSCKKSIPSVQSKKHV